VRSRRALTVALLALAATLALAVLAGCGSGTATVIFKNKTQSEGGTNAGESATATGGETAELEGE
jgi:RecA/RadA recombinase